MSKSKKTFKIRELNEKVQMMNELNRLSMIDGKSHNDKLAWATKRNQQIVVNACKAANDKLTQKSQDAMIERASTDESGNLIGTEPSQFQYKPKERQTLNKELKKFEEEFLDTEVEIEPYYFEDLTLQRIDRLDGYLVEELVGFLFKENVLEARAEYLNQGTVKAEHGLPA